MAAGAAAGSAAGPAGQAPPAPGEFTEGTVHRARAGRWKRPVLAAAVVLGVTMAGIITYEPASGHTLGGGRSTSPDAPTAVPSGVGAPQGETTAPSSGDSATAATAAVRRPAPPDAGRHRE
ncbi:hypothetical protein [Streptomyces sp. NPDC093598]|uniref:hypothetical protein n=1 Tax=Streptomyces sp. NPDC093598 TaxID=3366046 RepID=UPI00382C61E0